MTPPTFGVIEAGRSYIERVGSYGFLLDDGKLLALIETPSGIFLPGGGSDPGESAEDTLKREVFEEIGLHVVRADFSSQAIQYHFSKHYQKYFKNVGSFFRMVVQSLEPVKLQEEHRLRWRSLEDSAHLLTQEYQRWALRDAFKI